MISNEQVQSIIKRFLDSRHKIMPNMDKANLGIGLVLRYLSEAGRPVSAGEIAKYMNVSTARVAVLLKTVTDKGYVVTHDDPTDARKTLVRLSKEGQTHIEKTKHEMFETMRQIIDNVGIERMELFLDISAEIQGVMTTIIANKKGQ